MIRPGKAADAFGIVDVLQERHAETRYAVDVPIDPQAARKLFAQAAQRHGGQHEGSTFLMVSEANGEIEAFMLGQLSRVYMIGEKLCASDCFLIGRKRARPRILLQLLDRYIAWAEGNPKVYEIGLSWADSIPGNEGIIDVYERRGFELCARTFRRTTHHTTTALREAIQHD